MNLSKLICPFGEKDLFHLACIFSNLSITGDQNCTTIGLHPRGMPKYFSGHVLTSYSKKC